MKPGSGAGATGLISEAVSPPPPGPGALRGTGLQVGGQGAGLRVPTPQEGPFRARPSCRLPGRTVVPLWWPWGCSLSLQRNPRFYPS